MYSDNEYKFTVIVNKKQPTGVILNAIGHAMVGLSGHLGHTQLDLLDYLNTSAGLTARISRWPVIVLSAKNSNQLRSTLEAASGMSSVVTNAFTTSMIAGSAESQIAATARASADQLDYVALAIFGPQTDTQPITKRFSLLKALG